MKSIKLVIIGDNSVGKTCLFTSYVERKFPTDYVPNVFGGYTATKTVDGKPFTLGIWDTAGQPEYDRLRPLAYPQTDVYLICFSLLSPESYDHVRTKWYPEISHFGPSTAAFLLIGTKLDLRDSSAIIDELRNRHMAPIQYQQGVAMCRDIGADMYLECSALTLQGVDVVFEEGMRAVVNPRSTRKRKNTCIIL
ncbi:hypothetical protein GALMADRAFT_262746 [Galerina marginata CBS 339.88]|uniref:Uncharacterized protein n=1 Tax=Galerina marginata (strain CBS 339.88) TaxID=685588 RepID=A0A067TZM3_GALM3|nr:hypothetical protein GALMADRAFT_262746 [Galerina marginata CBS 339.88]